MLRYEELKTQPRDFLAATRLRGNEFEKVLVAFETAEQEMIPQTHPARIKRWGEHILVEMPAPSSGRLAAHDLVSPLRLGPSLLKPHRAKSRVHAGVRCGSDFTREVMLRYPLSALLVEEEGMRAAAQVARSPFDHAGDKVSTLYASSLDIQVPYLDIRRVCKIKFFEKNRIAFEGERFVG
jgi:hypothetical protein